MERNNLSVKKANSRAKYRRGNASRVLSSEENAQQYLPVSRSGQEPQLRVATDSPDREVTGLSPPHQLPLWKTDEWAREGTSLP